MTHDSFGHLKKPWVWMETLQLSVEKTLSVWVQIQHEGLFAEFM